ncbi:hypothetical protein NPIL_501881 [Nephila pilipes]|uniref:Histone H2A/H2B/H3 domain-containing protein n=1 Tax=Nephila pilipes TaxID=299642 RepID=A0A8X6NJG9_NEPPI|nr:hypothetical protein NPIL_501881 [Nephila pilipes]
MDLVSSTINTETNMHISRKFLRKKVSKTSAHFPINRRKNHLKPFDELRLKKCIIRMNKMQRPNLQLSSRSVEEINDFMRHIIEMFEIHLQSLMLSSYRKTLTVTQLEKVTRLCLPKILDEFAIGFGRYAVSRTSTDGGRQYVKKMKLCNKIVKNEFI